MKLEYRILEAENKTRSCNYCLLDVPFGQELTFTPANYEIVAYDKKDKCVDIASICDNCKKDLENGTLPYCEECGRLKRNRGYCFCSLQKERPIQSSSSQTIEARLAKKTKELEKELKTAKEGLKIEREEVAKFQEKSEEWSKKQKQELLDKIKSLEEKINHLEEENRKLKDQQKGQIAQIEVKETKRWSWLKIKK